MKNFRTILNTSLKNKTVVVRLDLNVPMKNNKIVDPQKIIEALPTLTVLLNNNCKIIVLSHLGRIKSNADIQSKKYSLAPIANFLSQKLGKYSSGVYFLEKNYGPEVKEAVNNLQNKEILVLENTRYADIDEKGKYIGWESKNNPTLAKFWARLGHFFIYDAFATIHRKHASTYGIGYYHKKTSAIGILVERELKNIENAMKKSGSPKVGIIGGAKVNDKIDLIEKLTKIADIVLVGGALAFTFLAAKGYDLGENYVDHSKIKPIQELLKKSNNKIILPMDFACVINKAKSKRIYDVMINQTLRSMSAYDIGNEAVADFASFIIQAKTIIWNGPLGKFEDKRFAYGTKAIAETIAYATKNNGAYSLIAGGDTGNAIKKFKLANKISYISTGGGATFALICNENLPGLENISIRKQNTPIINLLPTISSKLSKKKAKVIKIKNSSDKEINGKPLTNDDPSGSKLIDNLVNNAKQIAINRAKKQKEKDDKFIQLDRQKAISNENILDKNIENFVPKMNSNNKIINDNNKNFKK